MPDTEINRGTFANLAWKNVDPRMLAAIDFCLDASFPMLLSYEMKNLAIYNQALARLLKLTPSTRGFGKPGDEIWDGLWPDFNRAVESVKKTKRPLVQARVRIEASQIREAKPAYFHFSHTPVRDESGEVRAVLSLITDVTHDVRPEDFSLETEKNKLEALFADASTSMALLRGPELIFENANPSYRALFNGRVKIGVPILELMPELKDQVFSKLLQNVFHTGIASRENEARAFLRRHDDAALEERYFRQTYTQVKDASGVPYGVFIHAIEITDEIKARTQLEVNRQRLALALEAAKMGTWHMNLVTHEATNSKEFMSIFEHGVSRGKIAKQIAKHMHPDDIDEINRVWQKAVDEKTPYVHEYRIVTATGKVKWVHSRGQATYDENGKPLSLSGILFDITDKKLAEERLSKLTRDLQTAVSTRDEFMSLASHELKTPLTSLSLLTQSMQRNVKRGLADALSPERVLRLIQSSEKNISRLVRLVDDMLDVTRIESGKLSYTRTHVNLRELISDVYQQMKPQLEQAGCEVSLDLAPQAVGNFDQARIEQVVTNLITNAMKYARGHPIQIKLQAIGTNAVFSIKDGGIGIAAENFERIFARFERVVSSNEVSGLGLGLYLTREIVQAHGGKMWLESSLGKGAEFFVELPLI